MQKKVRSAENLTDILELIKIKLSPYKMMLVANDQDRGF